ncbi:Necrosis inducing protein NPP1 [Phytophthora megakarya]|uniref:Necrosis inducing protein NPP1 n=1 Tax=Phytophthora megakarya TaxID=4795 RepID=A0A225VAN6_9STRA|nr:Necrosis inducing protein NPP1 [Phytophthora megakarya]
MNLITIVLCCAVLHTVRGGTVIDHDQVQPFDQPEPVTISEKAAVKYKPQLFIRDGCASFPAVNAAGEITGGLKGTKNTEDCEKAPLGSQMYGRSTWYQDKWAMMYAWYFPKNFGGYKAKKRHDWASIVLWIDNPAVETPKILGASLSQQTLKPPKLVFLPMGERLEEPYQKMTELPPMAFVGMQQIQHNRISRWQWNYTYEGGSNISTRVAHTYADKFSWIASRFSYQDGTYHDLIMWEQLTAAAREALNSADFEEAKVPFNENNFETALGQAWPF